MKVIDTSKLTLLGQGGFGAVYQLSRTTVLKVYNNGFVPYCRDRPYWWNGDPYSHMDLAILLSELDAALKFPDIAVPILDIVIAEENGYLWHAAVKPLLRPLSVKGFDRRAKEIKAKVPKSLSWDCFESNIGVDKNGRLWMFDTHEDYDVLRSSSFQKVNRQIKREKKDVPRCKKDRAGTKR